MGVQKLTKNIVDRTEATNKELVLWDSLIRGFGCRVSTSGKKTYFLFYRNHRGQQRKPTIGRHGQITLAQARNIAQQMLGEVAAGQDPSAERKRLKQGKRFAEFADVYMERHAKLKKKPSSVRSDQALIRKHLLPRWGTKQLDEIDRATVIELHTKLAKTPGAANRLMALVSKMINLAVLWGFRDNESNPCKYVERYPENKCERYLSMEELLKLGRVLTKAEQEGTQQRSVVSAIRLLLHTGCRLGEILDLKWAHVSLERKCLFLEDSKTGAKTVFLSDAALKVLLGVERREGNPYVIIGRYGNKPLNNLRKPWYVIRAEAGLDGVRLHDLRHTYASLAVGMGESLAMVGRLLGHKHIVTTQRYAHLATAPMLKSANRVGGLLEDVFQ